MPHAPAHHRNARPGLLLAGVVLATLWSAAAAAQVGLPARPGAVSPDPGVRTGTPGAGGPLPGLTAPQQAYFTAARARFQAIDSVAGTVSGAPSLGLGPRFNGTSCAGCHSQPSVGGTGPAANAQIAMAHDAGATNVIPSFITALGPTREARFIRNADGSADGGVHPLFTIAGRSDAQGCTLAQPNFAAQLAAGNVVFRIPTPMFGLGLVEATPDLNLQAAFSATASQRASLGIGGHFNTSGNDGTITRFGWKAQNKSLLMFAGEAYNVEMGVSNELFPNEIAAVPGCVANGSPEDGTNLSIAAGSLSPASDYSSDIINFAAFGRLSAAPAPAAATPATAAGAKLFTSIGCAACHTASQTTGPSSVTGALNNVTYAPYSDFAVHAMGAGLADGVTQGTATGLEFRTAPLWGVGQRLFFLHDGRTSDLNQAVLAHAGPGSEANAVIGNFTRLTPQQVGQLMQFLRSL